jgi:hypothetical protein
METSDGEELVSWSPTDGIIRRRGAVPSVATRFIAFAVPLPPANGDANRAPEPLRRG